MANTSGKQFAQQSEQVLSLAVTEFIDEYDRLISALKKDYRKGKKLSCLSSLTAMKPLHSHLMEEFVSTLGAESPEKENQESLNQDATSKNLFGYL